MIPQIAFNGGYYARCRTTPPICIQRTVAKKGENQDDGSGRDTPTPTPEESCNNGEEMNVIIPVISNPSSADVEIRSVNLSTDINLDGASDGDDEILEDSVGVIVVANIDGVYDIPPTPTPSPISPAIRKEVLLTVNELSNDYVILNRASGNIRIFQSQHGTDEITFNGTDNKFQLNEYMRSLYVQGGPVWSDHARDIELYVTPENELTRKLDRLFFTVIWGEVEWKTSGTVSDENQAREEYRKITYPNSYSLGNVDIYYQKYIHSSGIAVEFKGEIFPNDIELTNYQNKFILDRFKPGIGNKYKGLCGDENWGSLPAGEDRSLEQYRDDHMDFLNNELIIFDIDAPALTQTKCFPPSSVIRYRNNFDEFIICKTDSMQNTEQRCSNKFPWSSCISFKRSENASDQYSGTTGQIGVNTMTVSGETWPNDQWDWFDGIASTAEVVFHINSNISDTFRVDYDWQGSLFEPIPGLGYCISTNEAYFEYSNVANDNIVQPTHRPTTWNLEDTGVPACTPTPTPVYEMMQNEID